MRSPFDLAAGLLQQLADWQIRDETRRRRKKWILIGALILVLLLLRFC